MLPLHFDLGFSMAMHCSTNVLKLMCFFFPPGPSAPDEDAVKSCELLEELETSLDVAVVVEVLGNWVSAGDSGAMIRGGEFLRKGRERQLM